jgi:chromosome segregation ATPase
MLVFMINSPQQKEGTETGGTSMAEPCNQQETIKDIWEEVSILRTEQRDDIGDLKDEIRGLVAEFRDLTKEMRDVLVEGREMKTRLSTSERNVDILFGNQREVNKDMHEVQRWINKEEGARMVLKTIPIVCTIFTTIIAIVVFLYQIRPVGG